MSRTFKPLGGILVSDVAEGGPGDAHGQGHVKDVDGDGGNDLLLHFKTQDTGVACGGAAAFIVGDTYNGVSIQGSDDINTGGVSRNGTVFMNGDTQSVHRFLL